MKLPSIPGGLLVGGLLACCAEPWHMNAPRPAAQQDNVKTHTDTTLYQPTASYCSASRLTGSGWLQYVAAAGAG